MADDASKSRKTKGMTKQPDLRQFFLKKAKHHGTSSSSPIQDDSEVSSKDSESLLSPLLNSTHAQENEIGIDVPSGTGVRLEGDEYVYNVDLLPHDPGKRINIMDYPPNQRNAVRRAYILKNPCQPKTHNFPQRDLGGMRRFSVSWFGKYDWLEYSIEKDAAFCFVCYLFKNEVGVNVGGDAFVNEGFRAWNKPDRFEKHVSRVRSAHNIVYEKYVNLRDSRKKSILNILDSASDVIRSEYEIRLRASISCLRFLLHQGLASRGHDERDESINRGNFLELLKWLGEHNEDVKKVIFENAPGNNQMTSPIIQHDIISCCAKETSKRILEELGDDYFAILADESSDVSQKEQLALCLRYVNGKTRIVVERFLGLVHVADTTALSLKCAIVTLLVEHSLSPSKLRGQGYDGASNMKGEINGLKTLIMNDTPSAYYVHCFAHQLQLTLVAVAKRNNGCCWLFEIIANLLNVVGVSCKRREMIREFQAQEVAKALESGEVESGSGLNQELGLRRPGDTRWGSHYKTLLNIIHLFPTIVKVLEMIGKNASVPEDRIKAQSVLYSMESFEFIFMAHLMLTIFGYTNDLNLAMQRRDQDIVNAMSLVSLTKDLLQNTRDSGWENLLDKVNLFCTKIDIDVLDLNAYYIPRGRSKRFVSQVTNIHHFRFDLFVEVIDLQVQELNERFDEANTELLICMTCLSPKDGFSSFHKEKILKLATFYPSDFTSIDLMILQSQLDIFIEDMRKDVRFQNLDDIGALLKMLVETKKHVTYPKIYLLIKVMLILPVATASVERVFSGMTYVKNKLRNSMCDQLLNDCLVTFIEKEVFLQVPTEDLIERFQKMKTRRIQLKL